MITQFIIKNILTIHDGNAVQKAAALFKLASVPAVGFSLSERFAGWYFDNQVFMSLVLLTIIIDMILGAWVHWGIKHDFSFRKLFWGFAGKTLVLILGYVLFEMIHQIVEDVEIIATYFKVTLKLVVILYPAGSAMVNMSLITNGRFPPIGWMHRLERFSKDGKIEVLKHEEVSLPTSSGDAIDGMPEQEEKP